MLLEVWHLEGGERGRAATLHGPLVHVGSDPGAELCLGNAAGVLPDHAEIVFEGSRIYLHPKGAVRLNGRSVGDVALKDGDLLDIGDDVHLRIRLVKEESERAREFSALLARAPLPAAPRRSSPIRVLNGRLGAAATLLFAAILVGGAYLAERSRPAEPVGTTLARERNRQDTLRGHQQRATEQRMRALYAELTDLEGRMAERSEVDARVGEVQRAVAQVETNVIERVDSEIAAGFDRRPELQAARDAVLRMEQQDVAAERIISTYAGSVCLIQGSYGFGRVQDGEWRFLREATPDLVGDDIPGDKVPLVMDGDGPVFQVEYTGTGFLADRMGIVLTNRHIAEPWWHNDAAEPLIKEGWIPRFVHLRAYFPGRKKPFDFDNTLTIISDTTDLAALGFEPDGELPPPFRFADPKDIGAGKRVLLLGYPSGLDALIARSEEDFARKLSASGGLKPLEVLDALAERGLVRPLPTQGHVSDVLHDKLLFDAPTAVGGSGGPLVDMQGRVVAINYGILKAFSGANFGVPAKHALPLVEKARALR